MCVSGVCEREAPGILSLEGEQCDERGAFLPVDVCARTAGFVLQGSVHVRGCVCVCVRERRGVWACQRACVCMGNSVVDQQRALRIMQPTVLITL